MNKKSSPLMLSCLVIRGRSYTGKTYASRKLEKKLQTLCIHYDVIIELACECTRSFFENRKNEKPIVSVKRPFAEDEDLENFKNDFHKFISENLDFFKILYDTQIKNTAIIGLICENVLESFDPGTNLYQPVSIAKYLEKKFGKIFQLIIKYIIKDSRFFIIEGVYFMNESNFIELKKFCEEIMVLDCYCVPAIGVESYNYGNEEYSSLEKLQDVIANDFKVYN